MHLIKHEAYNFWDLVNEPLDCSQFITKLDYLLPNGTNPISMDMDCEEKSEALYYSIPVTMKVYDDIIIENYQYFRLDNSIRQIHHHLVYKNESFASVNNFLCLITKGEDFVILLKKFHFH